MNGKGKLIADIQEALKEFQIPAWLFYGFQNMDPIASRILQFEPQQFATRRWFYLVPAQGEPKKLVHRIESTMLDHLPGSKEVYLEWQQLHSGVKALLGSVSTVAMQYTDKNFIPYVSRVDAGTVDFIRSCGTKIISSGDLVQRFEAIWTDKQAEQHRATALTLTSIVKSAFEKVGAEITSRGETTELAIQRFILDRFEEKGLFSDHPPIVAVNENSANPHYLPSEQNHLKICKGDFLLIDLWAKTKDENSVYADITWTAFLGERMPDKISRVFKIVCRARDQGVDFLLQRFRARSFPQGWEVDDAVREIIRQEGYAESFVHRTGHNLGQEIHGNGVHFDNLETHDTRLVIPGVCCTIEPGIYLTGEFGVRSEINVYLREGGPEITTPPQDEILLLSVG